MRFVQAKPDRNFLEGRAEFEIIEIERARVIIQPGVQLLAADSDCDAQLVGQGVNEVSVFSD